MKNKLILTLLAALFIAGCGDSKIDFSQKNEPGTDLVSAGLLKEAGLQTDWQIDISLMSGEKINHLLVAESFVYVITDINTVFCFDRFNGNLRFIRQLARPNLPMNRPTEYQGALYTVVGDELWKLDPQTASVKMVQNLVNSSVCPIVLTRENLYVCGLDNRVSCYDKDDKWLKFQITADNDSAITSLIVEGEFMWFATEEGNVFSTSSYEPVRYWAFNASGKISGSIAKNDKYVYVSSEDTMVYKLSAATGRLAWKAPLGSRLIERANVYDDYVYQQTSGGGIFALDNETGNIVWKDPAAKSFVARDGDDVYVFTEDKTLNVMSNNDKGSRLKINFSNVDRCGLNTYDENIYILSNDGKLGKISKK